jgi:proteasome lid subunit RPN8/RPN11
MTLLLPSHLLRAAQRHGESHYPEEGAGLILGTRSEEQRVAAGLLPLPNEFEESARGRRYRIDPRSLLEAEDQAEAQGLEIIGVFHSHPDHPPHPSDFDRTWALPVYSYVITQVSRGKAVESRSWRLTEDHSAMIEEALVIQDVSGATEAP